MQRHYGEKPIVEKPDSWKILIADDEEEVHKLTRIALADYTFAGRGLTILSANSGAEAARIMKENPDTALALLDVVMETDDAGLKLVRYIREELQYDIVQIVLRTGQPDITPRKEAISAYDINGYTAKLELTAEKMFSIVTASLRAYWSAFSLKRLNEKLMQELEEREKAEEAVRNLTLFQQTVIDNADIWLDVRDESGKTIVWNKAAEKLSGYSKDEVLGHDQVTAWLYPNGFPKSTIKAESPNGNTVGGYESTIRCKNGKRRTIAWNICNLVNENSQKIGTISLGRDVTEQHLLENQLRQAQKMEAIGRMAGGLAHDFNNLLTVIRGYCDISLARLEPGNPLHGKIKQIEKAATRAEKLSRQLLSFSRSQAEAKRPIGLNALIHDMKKMLSRLLGSDIELKTHLGKNLGTIESDHGQIEQVIMNLVVNARDAMPQGGTLSILTQNVGPDSCALIQQTGLKPANYVLLSIQDTGIGMNPELHERIFEPFFTTKEKGKGTGLGLSTVYGIIAQCGGGIAVESAPGIGTIFQILFPRIDDKAIALERPATVPEKLAGTERILVVEDQPDVLRLTSETLHLNGYKVLEASNAGSALLICEEYRDKIDLILTDVIMPRMNGVQLVVRLRKILPDVKVLFMSGYAYNIIEQQKILEPGQNFIQKPFTADALLKMVRGTLDGPPEKTPLQ